MHPCSGNHMTMTNDPILDRFLRLAATRADAPLFVAKDRQARVEDVHRLSLRVAERVRRAAIEDSALVGLAAGNGPAFAAGYLGLRLSGCRVLLLDSRTPTEERGRIHRSLGTSAELLAPSGWPDSSDEIELSLSETSPPPPELRADISTVRLTSGSSGLPRGIAHTSEALLADDSALRATMSLSVEKVLASVPLSHAYGFASIFLPAITDGWAIATPHGIGPFAAIEATTLGEVSFLPTVPAYLQALLKMDDPPPLPKSVRLVITAGAPLKPETAELFYQTYGQHVHVFYGASEVGGITYDRIGSAGTRGTLGSPVEGVAVHLDPVPGADNNTGVVVVESPAAAIARFPEPDPALGDGCFRTSDLGRFENGELVLLGRIDSMLNIRGKKVNPREIEEALETMRAIDEVIVAGITIKDDTTVAALIAAGPESPTVNEIHRWCRGRLASYKIPRLMRFVEAIPRTPRGKVDRQAVLRLLQTTEPES